MKIKIHKIDPEVSAIYYIKRGSILKVLYVKIKNHSREYYVRVKQHFKSNKKTSVIRIFSNECFEIKKKPITKPNQPMELTSLLLLLILFSAGCESTLEEPIIVTGIRCFKTDKFRYSVALQSSEGTTYFHTNHLYSIGDTIK